LLGNKSLTKEKQFFCQEVKPRKKRLFVKTYKFSQETIKKGAYVVEGGWLLLGRLGQDVGQQGI
jgi:hypothetical protein